jgi:3-hexulose-6-phosphate synthase
MKLQLALDSSNGQEAKRILEKVSDLVDIVEIGTPLIMKEGAKVVTEIKHAYSELEVLADLKIMDAGDIEAKIGFEAGADIVTVLGVAHNVTIRRAVNQARILSKKVMVDLIAVGDVRERIDQIDAMGPDYCCVHTAFDLQDHGMHPLREIQLVESALKQSQMAVAGGINPEILPDIIAYRPAVVIVGGFITNHPEPRQAALAIRELLV